MYVPPDHYLWDFWFAPHRPGEPYHLFHLEAPRTLDDPEARHWVATIGHAVSDDLVTWRRVGTALGPGAPGSWDDRAIWTGCTIAHQGRFYLFYTALSTRDPAPVQRIGLASSSDLVTWERYHGNPILTADTRWYETAGTRADGAEDFRDPFVLYDDARQEWLMLVCAHANQGEPGARGVVGLARSHDLLHWECLPPLTEPGEFGQLEVPQLVRLDGRWYLIFCTDQHSAARLARTGPAGRWFGTHYLVADDLRGPYRLLDDAPLVGDARGTFYAGRIEPGLTDRPLFFAWRRLDVAGGFIGGLTNPAPVDIAADGRLSVDMSRPWGDSN